MNKVLFIFFILIFVSCGDSHIVNDHKPKIEGVSSDCPLYFKTEDLCLDAQWELMPTLSTFGSMILTFSSKENPDTPLSPVNEPFMVLWMPSMSHGSSPVTVEFLGPGKYRLNDVFFIMAGPWDIRYQLKNQEDVIEEVIQKITI